MEKNFPTCIVHNLGLVEYDQAWEMQRLYASEVAQGNRPPTLMLLEHPHTYTLGRRAHQENLLWDNPTLSHKGVTVHWVDRGGDITYHGPGQLVGYPIIPLGTISDPAGGSRNVDYVGYVRQLEDTLIKSLYKFGIAAGQIPGLTGVWVQPDVVSRCLRCAPEVRQKPAKIASIGVKVDVHGISRHGFALNVAPDKSYWDGIIPCGIRDVSMISLVDLLPDCPPMDAVKEVVVSSFGEVFGYNIVAVNVENV